MVELTYSKAKVYSITHFLIKKYNLKLLSSLYRDYLLKMLTKSQYIIVVLLSNTYKERNIFQDSVLYKFIDNYIRVHNSAFFNKLIFD